MLVITVCAPVVKMSHSVFWCMSNVSTRRVDLCSKGALASAGGLYVLRDLSFMARYSDLTSPVWAWASVFKTKPKVL